MYQWTKATEALPPPGTYVLATAYDEEVGVNVTRPAYWDGEVFRATRDWRPLEERIARWTPYPAMPDANEVETLFRRILKGV